MTLVDLQYRLCFWYKYDVLRNSKMKLLYSHPSFGNIEKTTVYLYNFLTSEHGQSDRLF